MWVLKLGRIYGMEVPDSIRAEDVRLKDLLGKHCKGPYDSDGVQIGLGVYLEGGGVPVKKQAVKLDPLSKGLVTAGVHLKKEDWNKPLPAYRSFLWQNVEKAIWGCTETLKKKQIAVDVERLRRDLYFVEAEFLGADSKPDMAVNPKVEEAVFSVKESDDEDDHIVVQYRIEGHDGGSDHDKRVEVENILGEFLESGDLGYCDGGDIGSGTMNVFCFVKPGKNAAQAIIETLRKHNRLEGAVVAEMVKGEEKVVWPPDFVGEFSII